MMDSSSEVFWIGARIASTAKDGAAASKGLSHRIKQGGDPGDPRRDFLEQFKPFAPQRALIPPRRRPELTQAVQDSRRIRIDFVRVRASDPRNRADGLKIGRIPLTRHAAWSAKFEK
jgi:hypothetical protein